jgi:hypothetical protein
MGKRDTFPRTLAELEPFRVDPQLFVCPGTGGRPGSIRDVEDWTDYVYVGNNSEVVPRAALVISPPVNHGGKYGYVLTVDLFIARLPAHEVEMLIKEPWLLSTNTPASNIAYMRQHITVRIPKRLQSYYHSELIVKPQ